MRNVSNPNNSETSKLVCQKWPLKRAGQKLSKHLTWVLFLAALKHVLLAFNILLFSYIIEHLKSWNKIFVTKSHSPSMIHSLTVFSPLIFLWHFLLLYFFKFAAEPSLPPAFNEAVLWQHVPDIWDLHLLLHGDFFLICITAWGQAGNHRKMPLTITAESFSENKLGLFKNNLSLVSCQKSNVNSQKSNDKSQKSKVTLLEICSELKVWNISWRENIKY